VAKTANDGLVHAIGLQVGCVPAQIAERKCEIRCGCMLQSHRQAAADIATDKGRLIFVTFHAPCVNPQRRKITSLPFASRRAQHQVLRFLGSVSVFEVV